MSDTRASKTGKVIVVSGPSGVGKSSIVRAVIQRLDQVCLSRSVTTRPPAPGEVDGQDYYFVTREEFERQAAADRFLESAEVFGNLYGTPRDKTEDMLAAGRDVILEIDVQGGKQVKLLFPTAVLIFILPPDQRALAQRLNGRGRDSKESTERRLGEASSETAAAWQYYEHMVINENLEQAIHEVIQIIQGEPTSDV